MLPFKSRYRKIKSTNFWLLFSILFLAACGNGPPEVPVDVDKKFRTTPPSRIYFNNIRRTAYEWHQDPGSRTDFYLLRKIAQQNRRPALYPVIADIWMEDQAQVLIESGLFDTIPLPVRVYWQSEKDSGLYQMDHLSAQEMYDISMNIYRSLRKAHALEISFSEGPQLPLLQDQVERTNFRTSMQDYLRLTEFKE